MYKVYAHNDCPHISNTKCIRSKIMNNKLLKQNVYVHKYGTRNNHNLVPTLEYNNGGTVNMEAINTCT